MVCHCVEEANVLSSITTSLHWSPTSSQSVVAALVPSIYQPPSTIAMSVKCHVVFKVSKDVEKFKAKAVELVKISKVKTKISFTNNSIELAVIENDMCTVNAWVQTDCIPTCVDNPFHCMIKCWM